MTASTRSSASPKGPPGRCSEGIRSASMTIIGVLTGFSSPPVRIAPIRSASTPNTARRITSSVIARVCG